MENLHTLFKGSLTHSMNFLLDVASDIRRIYSDSFRTLELSVKK